MLMRRHGTIASALSEARASLKDPSRPFTPAAVSRNRSLFFDADMTRPVSRAGSAAGSTRSLDSSDGGPQTEGRPEEDDEGSAGARQSSIAFPRKESSAAADDDDDAGGSLCEKLGKLQALRRVDVSGVVVSLKRLLSLDGPKVLETLERDVRPLLSGEPLATDQRDEVLDHLVAALAHEELSARLSVARDALEFLEPSLTNRHAVPIAKALFDASRSPEHDGEFFARGVVGALLRALALACGPLDRADAAMFTRRVESSSGDFSDEGKGDDNTTTTTATGGGTALEAVVYVAGCVKNLSNDEARLRSLGRHGAICTLCDVLRACVEAVAKRAARRPVAHVVVQVTGALRNLCAEKSQARQLEASRAAPALAATLRPFAGYWELSLNAARALAKLSVFEPMRHQLNADPRRLVDMLEVLKRAHVATRQSAAAAAAAAASKHPLRKQKEAEAQLATYPAIVVRLAFVLGNLTAANDRNRRLVGLDASGVEVLVPMLAEAAEDWLGASAGVPSATALDENRSRGLEHVVIKLIRLVANVSINPAVGVAVAHHPAINRVLTPLMEKAQDLDREELLLNVVSAVTNLSYYVAHRPPSWNHHDDDDDDDDDDDGYRRAAAAPRSLFGEDNPERTCAQLLGVLLHTNHEAVSEAARAFGNFSRAPQARLVLRTLSVDEALVLLLAHPNRDVVFSACGALVNIAGDPATKAVLWRTRGHVDLISVARRAGLRDLDLSAVTFKALHNLLLDVDVGEAREKLGADEHDRLKQTLDELVDAATDLRQDHHDDDDDSSFPDATDDFLAAARALLSILDEG